MSLLGNIWVKLGLKSDDFQKGMDDATRKAEKFGTKLGTFTAKAVLGVASLTAAMWKFAKYSVQAFNEQEAANIKLQNSLRNTGAAIGVNYDELVKYAQELQHVNGFADEATMNAMSTLTTFRSVQGDVFKATIKAAQDMAAFMGTDLNTAVMQLGKALEAPEVGLTMLRRSGVVFTREMTENIRNLVKEGKLYEAQLLILNEVNERFGGSAERQANTVAGAWSRVGLAFNDLAEHIGSANNATKNLATSLEDALRGFDRIISSDAINVFEKLDLIFGGFWSGKTIQKMVEYDKEQKQIADNAKKYAADRVAGINTIEEAQAQLRREEAALANMGEWRKQDRANTEATIAALNQLIQRKNQEAADAEEAAQKAAEEAKERARQYQEWLEQHSGIINGLRDEIAEKEKQRKMATDRTVIGRLNEEIELLKKKLELLDKIGANGLVRIDQSVLDVKLPNLDTLEPEQVEKLVGLDAETLGKELDAVIEEQDDFLKKFEDQKKKAEDISQDFAHAIQQGVVSAIDELAEAIGTGDWDATKMMQALLTPLADAAISAGTIIVTTGEALEALKTALMDLFGGGPQAAAVAGAALIAAGFAAKAGLALIASGNKSSSATSGGNPYTYTGGYGMTPAMASSVGGSMQLEGTVTVKGQDLQIALDNYNKNRRR